MVEGVQQGPVLVGTFFSVTAHRRDLRIAGRLAVPCSLYHTLCASLGGSRAARRAIGSYQRKVLEPSTRFWRPITPSPPPNPMHSTLPTGGPSHAPCDPAVAPYPLDLARRVSAQREVSLFQWEHIHVRLSHPKEK